MTLKFLPYDSCRQGSGSVTGDLSPGSKQSTGGAAGISLLYLVRGQGLL